MVMQKISLTLDEILLLKNEIYGSKHPVSGELMQKGLLNQPIPIKLKYWLNILGEQLLAEDKIVRTLYNDLGQKYGEVDENGNIVVYPYFKNDDDYKVNPKFLELQEEYSNLLKETKEIEYTPFKLSDLDNITTEENYPVFLKLVIND